MFNEAIGQNNMHFISRPSTQNLQMFNFIFDLHSQNKNKQIAVSGVLACAHRLITMRFAAQAAHRLAPVPAEQISIAIDQNHVTQKTMRFPFKAKI